MGFVCKRIMCRFASGDVVYACSAYDNESMWKRELVEMNENVRLRVITRDRDVASCRSQLLNVPRLQELGVRAFVAPMVGIVNGRKNETNNKRNADTCSSLV